MGTRSGVAQREVWAVSQPPPNVDSAFRAGIVDGREVAGSAEPQDSWDQDRQSEPSVGRQPPTRGPAGPRSCD